MLLGGIEFSADPMCDTLGHLVACRFIQKCDGESNDE
jgi:hypothetical protein